MLTCLIGKSGSGKTSLAKLLEERIGINRIKGYTTRPKRDESDDDYNFVDNERLDFYAYYDDILCETEINGYHYWKLKSEITGDNQTIIVNPEGLRELYETDIELVVINLVADWKDRYYRILESVKFNQSHFATTFSTPEPMKETANRLDRDTGFECLKVDWTVDANRTIEEVYEDVKKIIEMQ